MTPSEFVILIPSLQPDERLPAYIRALMEKGFSQVVVVDDGSSQDRQHFFEEMAAIEGCHVLHHEVNQGKGIALKTGYRWILDNMPQCAGVITADADGQHTVPDCWRLAETMCAGGRALYLGSRDFTQEDVPPRSRFGNKTTSSVFKLLYGVWLPDTQTGLRGFLKEDLPFMLEVEGARYEYEMQVLIACARAKLPMIPMTIKTVYENNNEGSHFHPVRDSIRIYKVILGGFLKFMGSSILCFLLDNILFSLLNVLFFPKVLPGMPLWSEFFSTVCARLVSAPCNFLLNKNFVFKFKGSAVKTGLRYALLCLVIMFISGVVVAQVVQWLHLGKVLAAIVKIAVDTVLYFLSYRVQETWVFAKEESK